MKPIKQWENKTKIAVSVGGAAGAAGVVTLGTVYCAEKFLPRQMDWLKNIVAEHIVLPHLGAFERASRGLERVHKKYDARKRDWVRKHGGVLPKEIDVRETPREHAESIADGWVTFLLGLTVEYGFTMAFQKLWLNKKLGIDTAVGKMNHWGTATQLGAVALMPTLLPGPSENAHHGIRRMLERIGLSKESADKLAVTSTYVLAPGILAMGVEGMIGYNELKGPKR